jgi:hypothetical protein
MQLCSVAMQTLRIYGNQRQSYNITNFSNTEEGKVTNLLCEKSAAHKDDSIEVCAFTISDAGTAAV